MLGQHPGVIHFTVGQRKGLGLAGTGESVRSSCRWMRRNARVVVGPRAMLSARTIRLRDVNWLGGEEETIDCAVKVRSMRPPVPARVTRGEGRTATVELFSPEDAIAPGQACVFYKDSRVLGGGWIAKAERNSRWPHESHARSQDHGVDGHGLPAAIVDNFSAGKEALLERTASLIKAAARASGAKVIYVVVGFRAGYPEVSPRNKSFSAAERHVRPRRAGTEIHAVVAPAEGEVVVTKHRVGAFLGTDLDMVLRANGIETMIMAGIATSGGGVRLTLRYAADAD